MTKADLVEHVTTQIARTAGPMISKKDCARVVDSFLDAIKEALREQHNIEVRGFGTFKIRQRKTRMARNPRTGAPVEVSARPVPVFKPSKELRALVAHVLDLGAVGSVGRLRAAPVRFRGAAHDNHCASLRVVRGRVRTFAYRRHGPSGGDRGGRGRPGAIRRGCRATSRRAPWWRSIANTRRMIASSSADDEVALIPPVAGG